MLNPNTTTIVPIHFPKIKPPRRAIGEPNPKNGNTHKTVDIKKITRTKNKLEFLRLVRYKLFSLIKSYDVICCKLNFEKKKNKKTLTKIMYDIPT